ncbi:MAG: phosphatase PAP2 family protein [Ignavibacteria bacterium]
MKSKFLNNNIYIYISAVISFLILTSIVFLFPVEFSGYKKTDVLAPVWYAITETGGWEGWIFIFIILLLYLLIYFKKSPKKYINIIFFLGLILFTQILLAGVSQFYVKNLLHRPRPAQLFLIEKGYLKNDGQEFFAMSMIERRKYLHQVIKETDDSIKDIYPPILNNWIYDSGFSFPSGHSQTGFFLGTMIAYILFKTLRNKSKYFFIAAFLWAILVALSRVVIGIHYPVDVTAGALIGMSAAIIILSLKRVNNIFA